MPLLEADGERVARWRLFRQRIAAATSMERYQLLRNYGEDVRGLTPLAAKATVWQYDTEESVELAVFLGVLVCGCLTAEPANPGWIGRDRFFIARRQDLLAACSALSGIGFFPPELIPRLLDYALHDRHAGIPGLDNPGAGAAEQLAEAWESAVESGRDKRRWRERLGRRADEDWAAAEWRDSPATWRTFVVADARDEAVLEFRRRPENGGELAAGLVAALTVARQDSDAVLDEWRRAGWQTALTEAADYLAIYETLRLPAGDRPLALLLVAGQGLAGLSRRLALRRSRDAQLLGELPDDIFHSLMGESLDG